MSPETVQLLDQIVCWSARIYFIGLLTYMWLALKRIQQRDGGGMDPADQKDLNYAVRYTGFVTLTILFLSLTSLRGEQTLLGLAVPLLLSLIALIFFGQLSQTRRIRKRLLKVHMFGALFMLAYYFVVHTAQVKQDIASIVNLFRPV